jgi:hypothetical protein
MENDMRWKDERIRLKVPHISKELPVPTTDKTRIQEETFVQCSSVPMEAECY